MKDDEKCSISERLNSKNELFYKGDVTADLMSGSIKLVTLRKYSDKYHGFKVGQKVTANCEGKKVTSIVWGVQEDIALDEVDPIVRSLDGFITEELAVEDMGKIYKDRDPKMPTVVIATIAEEKFAQLSEEQRKALLSQKDGKKLEEVVRDPLLSELMKYSLANWVVIRGGTINDWLKLYVENGLMSCEQYGAVVGYSKKSDEEYRKENDEEPEDRLNSNEIAELTLRGLCRPYVFGDLSHVVEAIEV